MRRILTLCLFAFITQVQANPLQTGFTAEYTFSRNDFILGRHEKILLINQDGQDDLVGKTVAEGFVSLFVNSIVYEHSVITISATDIKPIRYTYQEDKGDTKQVSVVKFNWKNNTLTNPRSQQPLPLTDKTQDLQSFLLDVMLGLQNKQSDFMLDIADLNEIQHHHLRVLKDETISPPIGTLATVLVQENVNDAKSPRFSLWCAPSLDYFPVLIRKTDPDGTNWDLSLRKFSIR